MQRKRTLLGRALMPACTVLGLLVVGFIMVRYKARDRPQEDEAWMIEIRKSAR